MQNLLAQVSHRNAQPGIARLDQGSERRPLGSANRPGLISRHPDPS